MCRMATAPFKVETETGLEEHLGLVRSVVLKYHRKGRLEDSELYSVGCLALVEAARDFDPSRSRFSTWATRVVRQRVVDEVRRVAKDRERGSANDAPEAEAPAAGMPVHLVESILALRKSDSRGHAKDKRVLRGYFLEGRTLSEIGRALGMSKEGARKRINSAISRIRTANRELLENST